MSNSERAAMRELIPEREFATSQSDGVLRWSCGHAVNTHTREAAKRCFDDSRVAQITERLVPRNAEGGASASPTTSAPPDARPQWRVDPPRGYATPPQRSFNSYAEAEAYAMRCPAHTRIIHPPDATQAAASIDTGSAGLAPALPSARLVTAEQFCTEAARLVGGPRAATHGDKSLNFTNIAELWNGYWRVKCRVSGERLSTPFDAHDVGCMMELFKIARRFSGSFNADDYTDAAGYAGCTGEIAAAKESTTHESQAPSN